jgi:pimeloyl-ACP methyl ester carboxylesterase
MNIADLEVPDISRESIAAAAAFVHPRRIDTVPDGMAFMPASLSGAPLNAWVRGAGETVLLVHGWEGSPADLSSFVEPLVQRGCRAVALELPAHARSDAPWTSVPHAAQAVARFGQHLGRVRAVIGHSVGGAVSTLALAQGLQAACAVLLAAPALYIDYAIGFGAAVGLDARGIAGMVAALKRDWQIDVPAVSTPAAAAALAMPALIVHADDDRVVPPADAGRIHAAWSGSRRLTVSGLGHRRLLADASVIAQSIDFIARAAPPRG